MRTLPGHDTIVEYIEGDQTGIMIYALPSFDVMLDIISIMSQSFLPAGVNPQCRTPLRGIPSASWGKAATERPTLCVLLAVAAAFLRRPSLSRPPKVLPCHRSQAEDDNFLLPTSNIRLNNLNSGGYESFCKNVLDPISVSNPFKVQIDAIADEVQKMNQVAFKISLVVMSKMDGKPDDVHDEEYHTMIKGMLSDKEFRKTLPAGLVEQYYNLTCGYSRTD
ncbi:hypothetical protein BY996DRAFT_8547419 [Phakopsora pachyrhizi]|nr:hypothetical protein BY996DRAFT_8547419 [Phakopsora pachyrhizi]